LPNTGLIVEVVISNCEIGIAKSESPLWIHMAHNVLDPVCEN